jgi:hypothetical protein
MAFGTRVAFDPVRELAFGSVSGTYAALGTPTSDNVRLISFSNSTNEDVYISFNGVTNHLRLVPNSFKLLDLSANKVRDDGLFIAVQTQIYVKYVSSLGTSGNVWAEVMYAEGGK